jgi:hypothetical protein
MLYHTLNIEPNKPMYYMIGRAVSSDGGQTWQKLGRIHLKPFGVKQIGHGTRYVRASIVYCAHHLSNGFMIVTLEVNVY